MLTADLVDVRRSGFDLELAKIDAKKRARAIELGDQILEIVRTNVGNTRADLEGELATIEVGMREQRLKDALVKLATDEIEIEDVDAEAAEAFRKDVFMRAAIARREGTFDREKILGGDIELFPDLKEAERITKAPTMNGSALAEVWERSRAQAVLLRATKVRVAIEVGDAHRARDLFRAIKFLGLIHTLTKLEEKYILEVDGPLSLFESVTKYGLKLALLVPILDACNAYALEASVRWGREKTALTFRMSGGRGSHVTAPIEEDTSLRDALEKLGWKARANTEILDLPGVGLCIPDWKLEKNGKHVYVEILGFYSRAAVWKRVELVEKGLARIVFAVSARLRVSEEVLPEDAPSALYVYKGAIVPRALSAKAEEVLSR